MMSMNLNINNICSVDYHSINNGISRSKAGNLQQNPHFNKKVDHYKI